MQLEPCPTLQPPQPQQRRQRMVSCDWERFADPATVTQYASVHQRLQAVHSYDPRRVAQCMTYLWNFVVRFNNEAGLASDPSTNENAVLTHLNGAREGQEHARRAWDRMQTEHGLRGRYLAHVQTMLSQTLLPMVASLAYVVNPTMRRPGVGNRQVMAARSQVRQFDIHCHGCVRVGKKKVHTPMHVNVSLWRCESYHRRTHSID